MTKISVFKPEIHIFLRKQLLRELEETNPFEYFTQYLGRIDVSSVKISFNLVKQLMRYEQKQKGTLFFESPCIFKQSSKRHGYLRTEQSLASRPFRVQNCFRINDSVVLEYMLSRPEHNSKHETTVFRLIIAFYFYFTNIPKI